MIGGALTKNNKLLINLNSEKLLLKKMFRENLKYKLKGR